MTTITMMTNKTQQIQWHKHGCILQPSTQINWLATHAGSSFALQVDDSALFDIYITGRDQQNRSLIGRVRIDINNPTTILEISSQPVLSLGDPGSFDENGTSYPAIVAHQQQVYMYYTGWVPTVLTPFQNFLGLAKMQTRDSFHRVSRAPIMPRIDSEYLGTGSVYVMHEDDRLRMWYTDYQQWYKADPTTKAQHLYHIKYAESNDGVTWQRDNTICITFANDSEHSICRPSVYKHHDLYHMWYCYRGDTYRIGYAFSQDGVHWQRHDHLAGIDYSTSGWDSTSLCYPHVFAYQDHLYLLYCGNDYGREGLGLASMPIKFLDNIPLALNE